MKMRLALAVACAAISTLVGSTASQAGSYNLTTDFSDTSNPNGPWSYIYNGGALAHQSSPLSNGNTLIPAIPAGGYFSTGNDLNSNTPDVFKAAVNGSLAGETDLDFLAGDIVVHSPNDGTALSIVWTAPAAGNITNFSSSVWYAHSSVDRLGQVSLSIAGNFISSLPVSKTADSNRNGPGSNDLFPFSVNAGDLITLSFLRSGTFGSLNGVAESFDFAPVASAPLPAALPLFMTGLAGLGWFGHCRRKQVV